MIPEPLKKIAEHIAGLGLDAARAKVKDNLDEKKLKAALTEYIERQRKYNEMCALAEEIDFDGLVVYISTNLLDKVDTRIFNPKLEERTKAREQIVNSACTYCKAETDQAKYRVSKCVHICLDIIRGFFERQLSMKDYILADKIVDAVCEPIFEKIDIAKNEIIKANNHGSLFSVDKVIELAKSGSIDKLGSGIKTVLDHASLEHPLFPHYGYDYRDGKILSKPLTKEAAALYPPKYVFTGSVKFSDQYYTGTEDPLKYAYRHQLPMIMEVAEAVKYLGTMQCSQQEELAGLPGNILVTTPPEFPPAFPCAIKVSDEVFYDYILLRTQEIEDDGTYVINNIEQGGHFYFEVRINPSKPKKPVFQINMDSPSNRELLDYVRFMDILSRRRDLRIYLLESKRDLIAGYINDFEYKTGFPSVEEEIDFLDRVCTIEDHFKITLAPHGSISYHDYMTVKKISDLIRCDEISETWNEVTFTGILDKQFREQLISMGDNIYAFSYVGNSHIDLFGVEFELKYLQTYKCAHFKDYEKTKKKAEILEDGESIKFTLCAGDDNTTIETLKIPESIIKPQIRGKQNE